MNLVVKRIKIRKKDSSKNHYIDMEIFKPNKTSINIKMNNAISSVVFRSKWDSTKYSQN